MIRIILIVFLSVVAYGAVRSYSVDLEVTNGAGRPCTSKQKIVDTIISRNCSVLLEEK